jgi:hypothetical protein
MHVMYTPYNLSALLVVQCENCKHTRQFNACMTEAGSSYGTTSFVIDKKGLFDALYAIGWLHSRGHWFCKTACMEDKEKEA